MKNMVIMFVLSVNESRRMEGEWGVNKGRENDGRKRLGIGENGRRSFGRKVRNEINRVKNMVELGEELV